MSMNGGDVAEQMVRILLNGTETMVRISGEGARHIATFLMAWAQQDHSRDLARHGRTSMVRLLKSGQELQVFRMKPEEYTAFKPQAKQYRLLYSALRNKQDKEGLIDLVVRVDEIPRVNHIFERIGYGSVQQGGNSKKKEPPSLRSSRDVKARSMPLDRESVFTTEKKPSVRAKLEIYRKDSEKQNVRLPVKEKGGKDR